MAPWRRGVALIVVLLVLAVLLLVGVSFLILQSADRSVSLNYMETMRVRMLARSGIEAAVAALNSNPFDPSITYWGNDVNANGVTDPGEEAFQAPSIREVALDWARRPSLALDSHGRTAGPDGSPLQYRIRGHDRIVRETGVSGRLDGRTADMDRRIYQIRIDDLSGRIFLNDGLRASGGNRSSVSQNLRRILNVLGSLPTVRAPRLGDRVVDTRPPAGYAMIDELRRFLTPEELRRVERFVTAHAWTDPNVANPVPLSAEVLSEYPVTYWRGPEPVFRRGRGSSAAGQPVGRPLKWFDSREANFESCAVYGMDELNPSYIEIVHRAPVNVNAASREVLTALIADVQGHFVSERRSFTPYCPSPARVPGPVEIPQRYYSWWEVAHSYGTGPGVPGAFGYLCRTMPLPAPGGTTQVENAPTADLIADHIIACRDRRNHGTMRYAEAEYGGPFRTWSQFHRFVDALVENGVLRDTRDIFVDNLPDSDWTGTTPVPSEAGRRFASYALGDALKANFNPNLHLNETNPDHNLFLRVDKTDLIVNSTEFTLRPTGYYRIESIGRILQLQRGRETVAGDTVAWDITAEASIVAEVKAFDLYRETSQRHFAEGTFAPMASSVPTNSGSALECGPEPMGSLSVHGDHFRGYSALLPAELQANPRNGSSPLPTGWGCEYGGYLQLSTHGGDGRVRTPGGKFRTERGEPHWPVAEPGPSEGFHAHFQDDFDLHFDRAKLSSEAASRDVVGSTERVLNHPDRVGDPSGPLAPAEGGPGTHRIARSFRLPDVGPRPPLPAFAPSDLRVDGFYSERNSGAAYLLKTGENFAFHGGVLAAWIKPGFFPEHTGKMRNFFSLSKEHGKGKYRNPAPFHLMFVPGHDKRAYEEPEACELGNWKNPEGLLGKGEPFKGGPYAPKCDYREPFFLLTDGNVEDARREVPTEGRPRYRPPGRPRAFGLWQLRPASLLAFRAATTADAGTNAPGDPGDFVDIENYGVTSCLNHNLHPHGLETGGAPGRLSPGESTRPNYLEAHRWTHVMLSWQVLPPW